MVEWRLERGTRRNSQKTLLQCHFAHHESNLKSLANEPVTQWCETNADLIYYYPKFYVCYSSVDFTMNYGLDCQGIGVRLSSRAEICLHSV